jgi:hypothetical protein
MRDILDGDLESPATDTDPNTDALTDAEFTGGDLSQQVFEDLLELFRDKGYDYNPDTGEPFKTRPKTDENGDQILDANGDPIMEPEPGHQEDSPYGLKDEDGNPLYYPDGTERNHHKWDTTIIVYDSDDCSNPNQSIAIVGYAIIELIDVLDAPEKLIRGKILCNKINHEPSHGGGSTSGPKASISGLVE